APIAKSWLTILPVRTWRLPSIVDIPLPQPTESVVTFDLDPIDLRVECRWLYPCSTIDRGAGAEQKVGLTRVPA
ncbi:hypothetical protein ACM757_29550, partial [Pseudomonas aeruginosa]